MTPVRQNKGPLFGVEPVVAKAGDAATYNAYQFAISDRKYRFHLHLNFWQFPVNRLNRRLPSVFTILMGTNGGQKMGIIFIEFK